MLKALDVAAREGDWPGCGLALVAALEAVSPETAFAVSSELVATLGSKIGLRQGRWMQFIERADDSLALAKTLESPDWLIALASAVKDTISAIAMSSRVRQHPVAGLEDRPGSVAVMGLVTHLSGAASSDGITEKREAWLQVSDRLAEIAELRRGGHRGLDLGPSLGLAVRAAEAGII